jgi:hypothetical protein
LCFKQKIYFLSVLEGRHSKSRCQEVQFLVRLLSWLTDDCLLTMALQSLSSCVYSRERERERECSYIPPSWYYSYMVGVPTILYCLNLITSFKVPSPNLITLEIRDSTYEFGENKIQSITVFM